MFTHRKYFFVTQQNFLDEIHSLRKRNLELESHIDVLRQRLLDRAEGSTIPPASASPTLRMHQVIITCIKVSTEM